jgi:hypothetical protein
VELAEAEAVAEAVVAGVVPVDVAVVTGVVPVDVAVVTGVVPVAVAVVAVCDAVPVAVVTTVVEGATVTTGAGVASAPESSAPPSTGGVTTVVAAVGTEASPTAALLATPVVTPVAEAFTLPETALVGLLVVTPASPLALVLEEVAGLAGLPSSSPQPTTTRAPLRASKLSLFNFNIVFSVPRHLLKHQ